MYYTFTDFIILLYTFLVISFAGYNEHMTYLILFSKLPDVLRAFTCARAIGNLWSLCFRVKIRDKNFEIRMVRGLVWKTHTFNFYWKYFAFKRIKNYFSIIKIFLMFFLWIIRFYLFSKFKVSTSNSFSSVSASFRVIVPLQMSLPKMFIIQKFIYIPSFYKLNFLCVLFFLFL